MNTKTFKTIDGFNLIIKDRKSAVIFELDKNQENGKYEFNLIFSVAIFNELLKYIEIIAKKSWPSLTPKEASSISSDYTEYYDRELDNNGSLSLGKNSFFIERPSLASTRLYQFNKGKMESFLYDFKKRGTP